MAATKRLLLSTVFPPSGINHATPPLGLLYIAAYLRERFSLYIRVIDQRVEGWSTERLAKEIISFEPDIVGLGCITPSAYALPEITGALRAALPDTLIVLGGPHISALRAGALVATDADLAVAGEGEKTMEQIVRAFMERDSMEDIPGLIRRASDGSVVINPGEIMIIPELDSLPMPAYDLIDLQKYWHTGSMSIVPRRKYISLFSSRGCPYGCIYCHNIFGRRFREHSAERVFEEVKYFTRLFGADDVEFLDDCFNLNRKRVFAYSDMICRETGPVKTAFPNALRADLLDEDSVDALVSAGMYFTSLSLESGSPRIQELIGKRLDIPKFIKATAICSDRRVFTNGYTMLGFPTETADEIRQTIKVAAESKLHLVNFFRVTPFPGTLLYEYLVKNNPEKLTDIPYHNMEYRTLRLNLSEVSDEELENINSRIFRAFFMKPDRIYRILRDYPRPLSLIRFIPIAIKRMLGVYRS